jgi:hypothetical protein
VVFSPAVSLWDAAGHSLGTLSFPGRTGIVGVGDPRVARITFGPTSIGWASVIDNRSGDATFIPSQ